MRYEVQANRTYRITDEGERELMAQFEAVISEEVRYIDGRSVETWLTIQGLMPPDEEGQEPIRLPELKMKAPEFAGCSWVMPGWGVRAVIMPGYGIKEDLRACIQMRSRPKVHTIYKHIGWTEIKGERCYLHSGGALSAKGNNDKIRVELPMELSRFKILPAEKPVESIRATLDLLKMGPTEIMWVLLAGTLAPLYGPVDFCIHLTGKTGTFKSEVLSLFQSHYGAEMDARHLPGSWSSTANALEAQAWLVKDAVFACDDFIPAGTSWQQKAYQTTADKLVRAQGNQSGRARLTDASSLQTTMYPRGIVLSTGEDTPEGHSVRARMMILEVTPGDIEAAALTKAQKNRPLYNGTVAEIIKSLAKEPVDLKAMAEEIRDGFVDIGHTRTPSMIGNLIAVAITFIRWARDKKAITEAERNRLEDEAMEMIRRAGERQQEYLESADPCQIFCGTMRHVFGAGLGHLRTLNGGIPRSASILGWTEDGQNSDFPTFKSHGPCIGWIKWDSGEIYLDATMGFNLIRKAAGSEISQTKQTLMKRLKDSGILSRVDDSRQRNTVRITAENHPRQVLALSISHILETQEGERNE